MARPQQEPHKTARAATSGGSTLTSAQRDRLLALVYCPALLILVLVFMCVRPLHDPDTWFHMGLGRYVLENDVIPKGDVYSFTAAGNEWISSGWLSSVLMHWLFAMFGPNGGGVIWLMFVAFAVAAFAPYTLALKHGDRGAMVLVVMSGLLAGALRFNPRPDMFSPLFATFVVIVMLTSDYEAGRAVKWKRLWLLPVLFILWANFHAGYMAGLIAVGIYGLYRLWHWRKTRERSDLMALVPCGLCFVVWMINPYGWRLAALAQKIKNIPNYKQMIFEWMPLIWKPGMNLPWTAHLGFWLLIAFVIGSFAVRKWRVPWWHLAMAGVFAALAVYQRRQIGLAAFVLPAIAAPGAAALYAKISRRPLVLPLIATGAAIVLCALKITNTLELGYGWPETGRQCRMLPCFPTDFLKTNKPPDMRMFNSYGMGGYLLYELGPKEKVFIDGRLDVYDPKTWRDYLDLEDGRMDIDAAMAKYGMNTFVIFSGDAENFAGHLAHRLSRRSDYNLVFFDDSYSIFVKKTPARADYLRENAILYANPFVPERFLQSLQNPQTRNKALQEMQRAVQETRSANANTLAAIAAKHFGDDESMRRYLSDALAQDPQNYLLRQSFPELR